MMLADNIEFLLSQYKRTNAREVHIVCQGLDYFFVKPLNYTIALSHTKLYDKCK
jgi:hypothetical protein